MSAIVLPVLRCTRCSYDWVPRKTTLPLSCPSCHSPYWNRPRKNKKKGAPKP